MTTRSAASTASPPPPDVDGVERAGTPRVRTLSPLPRADDGRVSLDALAAALGDADLFERAAGAPGWSYVVPRVGPWLLDDGHRVRWQLDDGSHVDAGTDPFVALDRWSQAAGVGPHTTTPPPGLPPFTGGLVGALGYELAGRVEPGSHRVRDDRGQPWLALRLAPVVVAVPPDRDEALLVGRTLSCPGWRLDGPALDRLLAAVADRTTEAVRTATRDGAEPAGRHGGRPVTVHSSMSRLAYERAVEEVLRAIAAGDAFQANLTHRLTAPDRRSSHELYRALRHHSPAPHGAVLADLGIASVSPETFLRVDDGEVTVRPIKGTRARSTDPRIDAAHADDLLTSAKDRAENVMVVDLERNDLGRVCATGSVRVPELCRLEGHPTVWHLTSEVTGTLPPGTGYGALLRATFPCGSITGAPKIAAMSLIDRLEPVVRGWYCGAIGMLGVGHASLSVAIRTAVRHRDGVDHAVGAGIVADSDPEAEHAETLAKAEAFLRAVHGVPSAAVTRR